MLVQHFAIQRSSRASLKEYALIQEFPDDWEFCGTPAQQYAQVGNAVPVRLGRSLVKSLRESSIRFQQENGKPYATRPETYRVVYVQSHVRTRQWYKEGKTYIWRMAREWGSNLQRSSHQAKS